MKSSTRRNQRRQPSTKTRRVAKPKEGKSHWYVGTAGPMVSRAKWATIPGLNCLEVNSTFYALLGKTSAANLAAMPNAVSFVFKVSKYITHIKRLKDVGEAWRKFQDSVAPLRNRTVAYLFQLPPSFGRNDENVGRIRKLASIIKGTSGKSASAPRIVVEFRNGSWLVPATYSLFRELDWCVSGVLVLRPAKNPRSKRWMGTMPTGVFIPPRTSPMMYLRVHGMPGYRGFIPRKTLADIVRKMESTKAPQQALIFNNVFFENRSRKCTETPAAGRYAAVCDAAMLAKLVAS